MMTDYSLRVGINISAYQVSATWGTMPDDERPVVAVEQSSTGYRTLIQRLSQTGHNPFWRFLPLDVYYRIYGVFGNPTEDTIPCKGKARPATRSFAEW